MSETAVKLRSLRRLSIVWLALLAVSIGLSTAGAEPERVSKANYKQAFHFSSTFLRQFVYDTSVTPNWIGKTDSFWYSYRTSKGANYWRVDPKQGTKAALFDHAKLATLLSEATRKPLDATQLQLGRLSINEEGTKLKFVVEDFQYEYDLAAEKLTKLGKAPPAPRAFPGPGGQFERTRRQDDQERRDEQREEQQRREDQQQREEQERREQGGSQGETPRRPVDYRVFAPDRKAYVFVRNHNLCLLETGDKSFDSLMLPAWPADFAGVMGQLWNVTKGPTWLRETKATQLSTDGVEDYSFGAMGTFGAGMDDGIGRPRVEWSRDSKSFYATRVDARGVQELFLVNSLATPRPTLEKYKYPMPGEEAVRKMELFVCDRSAQKLIQIKPKWKDESYSNLHWGKTSDELRFVRRDRLQRHMEFCTVNVRTGETKCLILEGFENANIAYQPASYIEETDEMIWWSERSGWGHFYLYDRNGKLKNAITSGLYRASRVVAVDPKKRLLYFHGNAR